MLGIGLNVGILAQEHAIFERKKNAVVRVR
jgi:hypothetical protein